MTHRPLVGITTFFAIGIFTNYLVGIPSFIVLPAIFLTIIVYTFLFIFYSRQNAAGPVRSGVLTLLILIFLTGILYQHFRSNSNPGNNISNIISRKEVALGSMGTEGNSFLLISEQVFPGHSGSPVFTKDGKVIGIVFGALKSYGGLAISVKDVYKILELAEE